MSDPNAPDEPIGDDPVDRAYAEAESLLRDEAERAARRARVLAAVAAAPARPEPEAQTAPAAPSPPPRKPMAKPAPWLMAAGVAGVAALVGLRIAPTAVERPRQVEPPPPAPAPPSSPSPSSPLESAAAEKAAPPAIPPPAIPPKAAAPEPPAPPPLAPLPPAPVAPAPSRAEVPPALPIPPVQRRVEAPAAPPPLPIPPVERRVAAPAPSAAMAIGPAYDEPRMSFVIANPDWARRPSGEDIAQAYPDRARRTETNGGATISCTVTATGALAGCAVIAETPANYGFGEAALRLSRIYRMKPRTLDGAPVEGGMVRVPMEFKLPDATP